MKTKKMSVGELKTLNIFSAISSTGKEATFEVNGEYAVDIVTDKKVKLDSIRRSWKIIVGKKEEETEVKEQEVNNAVESNEEQVQPEVTEEVAEVTEEVAVIKVGSVVALEDGREGVVADEFHGRLTIELNGGEEEESRMIDEVTLLKKKAPKKPKAQKAPKEPKEPKAPRVVRRSTAEAYEQIVLTAVPAEEKVSETSTKQIFIEDDVTLEYITGTIHWKSAEENGCDMQTDWELLRSKKTGSWHGVFYKENGVIIKEATVDGKEVKDLSKSKSAVKKYIKEGYGVDVTL